MFEIEMLESLSIGVWSKKWMIVCIETQIQENVVHCSIGHRNHIF